MSKTTAKKVAKFAAKFAVTSSVSKVVHDVIEAHVTADTPIQQIQVWVGSIAVSLYAQDVTWNHVEEIYNEARTAIEEAKDQDPIINVTVVK